MSSLSPETIAKTPNRTLVGAYEDAVVVSTGRTTKTLTGTHRGLSERVLQHSDGDTELREIPRGDATGDQVVDVAEKLRDAGLLYVAERLAPLETTRQSLLESMLLSTDVESRAEFVPTIESTTVSLRGDESVIDEFEFGLDAIEWARSLPSRRTDVTVFVDTETVTTSGRVNEDWLESESVLLRLALDGGTLEVGPILTPSSQACLDCLTTRRELNGANQVLEYGWALGGRTREIDVLAELIVRFVLQAVVERIHPAFVGTIVSIDLETLECDTSRLLGVPGCESCHAYS